MFFLVLKLECHLVEVCNCKTTVFSATRVRVPPGGIFLQLQNRYVFNFSGKSHLAESSSNYRKKNVFLLLVKESHLVELLFVKK